MLQLLQSFDQIYVINLPCRADRRSEMDAQLHRVGLSFASPKVTLFAAVRPHDDGGFPSIGARGCFMSHLGVLREAQRRGLSSVLILEDDVDFSPAEHCADVLSSLQRQDWGFFYGGYRIGDRIPAAEDGCAPLGGSTAIGTTHFVGVRGRQLISEVVDYMESQLGRPPGHPDGGPMHVDGTYSWFRKEHPGYATLLAVPQIAHQRASTSDIAGPGWLERLWGMRLVIDKLRNCKNALRRAVY